MKFWLIVYIFSVDGEFVAKDSYEATDLKQCEAFAGDVARSYLNTQKLIQMHCLADDEYRGSFE